MRAPRAGLGSIGIHLVVLGVGYAWHGQGTGEARARVESDAVPRAVDITIVSPGVDADAAAAALARRSELEGDAAAVRARVLGPDAAAAPRAGAAVAPPRGSAVAPLPPQSSSISQSHGGAGAAASTASIETGGGERPAETGPGPGPGAGSRWLRMRTPDLRPPDELLARIANANANPGRPRETGPQPSGRLVPHGREMRAPDLVTPMRVHEDGTVAFEEKGDFEAHWILPIPSRKGIGNLIAAWYRDPYAQTRARRVQDMPKHEQAVEGGWDAGAGGDGAPDGNTRPAGASGEGSPAIPILGGSFDLTAWAMRKAKVGDPYASRKRSLIHATLDERVQIGAAYRARQLGRTPELMQRNLDALAHQGLPPAELREALFALWDECAEGEGPAGEAGEQARTFVIAWIRAHLPPGSADAYSADELARFDRARSSRRHFAPY